LNKLHTCHVEQETPPRQ